MVKEMEEYLASRTIWNNELFIIKFGGSITTNKNGTYELDYDSIRTIGHTIANSKFFISKRVVLVFGGGSFGNVAPTEFNLLSKTQCNSLNNISKMTTIMFSMLSEITDILISCGVTVYPFQASSIISQSYDGSFLIHSDSILSALDLGCIPVITGDLVFKNNGDFFIFSSDNVPELFTRNFNVSHVLYYSDVEGLLNNLIDKELIKYITLDEIENYRAVAGPSSRQDVTGGMINKLSQIEKLLEKNVSSELLSFSHFSSVVKSLKKEKHFGTFFDSQDIKKC